MLWRLFGLLLCCISAPTSADTIWLNNGDRLTGDIVLLDGGKLVLQTKYAGRVQIDWEDIDTLRSDKPLLVKQAGFETQHSQSLSAAGAGMVRVENGESKTMPLASITQLVPPRPFIEDWVWEGNVDAKLDIERDEDSVDDLRVNFETRLRHGRFRHVLDGDQRHETKNGNTIKDNWRFEYDQDYFVTDQWFMRGSAQEERDQFADINRQRLLGVGPGYSFWDDGLGRFELISQYNRVQLESDEGPLNFDASSIEWDYKRVFWGSRMEFFSTAQLAVPHIDSVDYVIESEMGLRYRINQWARLSLLYELNQTRALGQTSAEREYILGFGVGW